MPTLLPLEDVDKDDLVSQTESIYAQAKKILESLEFSLSDVVKTVDYLTPEGLLDYKYTGRVRKENLGPVYPGATGILMSKVLKDLNNSLSNNDSSWTYAYPSQNTDYKVIIENNYGCRDTFEVAVYVSPTPIVNAGINFWMSYGESINLNGFTNANVYYWESSSWISCPTCLNPQINPTETTFYILNVTDSIGCVNSDTVEVNIKGDIFVPNTFTPNGDGDNDLFEIKGENIESFELWIYNRWGEKIYNTTEISDFWDGKFEGNKCKIDSYIWVVEYFDFNQNFNSINGHVNLLE